MCLQQGILSIRKIFTAFWPVLKNAGNVFNRIFHLIFFLPPQFTSCKLAKDLTKEHPQVDYTPPSYITLLFTDLGILTPSAVSDELIKLYLWNIICTYRVICKINIFIPQINAIYLIHPLTAFQYSMANMDLGHMQNSSTVNSVTIAIIKRKSLLNVQSIPVITTSVYVTPVIQHQIFCGNN